MGKLLDIRGLSASADEKPILHDIDLSIGAGETHVLMGPNGAGKSTLGQVIMGNPEYTVTAGSITLAGENITEKAVDARSRAGLFMSFQAPTEVPGVPLNSFLRAGACVCAPSATSRPPGASSSACAPPKAAAIDSRRRSLRSFSSSSISPSRRRLSATRPPMRSTSSLSSA